MADITDRFMEGLMSVLEDLNVENVLYMTFAKATLTTDLKEQLVMLERCAIMLDVYEEAKKETEKLGKMPSDPRGEFEYLNEKCKIIFEKVWTKLLEKIPAKVPLIWKAKPAGGEE